MNDWEKIDKILSVTHARDKGWRLQMYAASPPGRLEAHEACISRMDADNDFTFDIGMYRAHVEFARAELDRENWPETRAHLADADAQLTLIGWIHDEDRLRGIKAESTAADAGKKGGIKSADSRKKRIISLLDHMEKLAIANPAFTRMDAKHLAKLAVDDAAKEYPLLWKQGSNQVIEYLGEVRRGDAGSELKQRYLALFPPKTT